MPPAPDPFRIAVISDAHFHDIEGDYGLGGGLALRPLADVARSPRVFNETGFALRHALDGAVAREIAIVVLLGDYSDDGQITTLAGLRVILDDYRARHGLRFYAVPGNHDMFGDVGRHRGRRFLNAAGGYDLVTSDPDRRDGAAGKLVVWPDMLCPGVEAAARLLPHTGYFRQAGDLHWETPFGASDAEADRQYPVRSDDGATTRHLMDLSYLVEPVPGLWLLMIDANVFVPLDLADRHLHDEEFADSTDAGWEAMLRHKPFVLTWMQDVAARARAGGKRLLTFSHYPVLDACPDAREDLLNLFGPWPMVRRLPGPEVAQAVVRAGIATVFSGHLHQNDTARHREDDRFLVNVGFPSLAAFPGCWKVVTAEPDRIVVETVATADMAMPEYIRQAYRLERAQAARGADDLIAAETYGAFLASHAAHLVARRHLRREWPKDMVAPVMEKTLADLANVPGDADFAVIPALTFVQDWYRVQAGAEVAIALIPPARLKAYRRVATMAAEQHTAFAALFRTFGAYLDRLPSDHFTIDLATGAIDRI